VKDAFTLASWILEQVLDFATEIHFDNEKTEHANAPYDGEVNKTYYMNCHSNHQFSATNTPSKES